MSWSIMSGSVESIRGRSLYGAIEEILAAVSERDNSTPVDSRGKSRDLIASISRSIDGLMSDYLDKTAADGSGLFTGYGTAGTAFGFPLTTKDSLEAEIGAYPVTSVGADSLEVPVGTPPSAELLKWWYDALNLMVWTTDGDDNYGMFLGRDDSSRQWRQGRVINGSSDTMEDVWNASSWTGTMPPWGINAQFKYDGYSHDYPSPNFPAGTYYTYKMEKTRAKYNLDPGSWANSFGVDFYVEATSDWSGLGELTTNYSAQKDIFFRYKQIASSSGETSDNTYLADDSFTPSDVNYPVDLEANQLVQTSISFRRAVIKFDVIGGFEYQ